MPLSSKEIGKMSDESRKQASLGCLTREEALKRLHATPRPSRAEVIAIIQAHGGAPVDTWYGVSDIGPLPSLFGETSLEQAPPRWGFMSWNRDE